MTADISTWHLLDVCLVRDAGLLGALGQVPDLLDEDAERLGGVVERHAEVDPAQVVIRECLCFLLEAVRVEIEAGVEPA